jgi:RND family efflux transporter MFP subunit
VSRRIGFAVIAMVAIVVAVVLVGRRSTLKAPEAQEPAPEVTVTFGKVVRTTLHSYVNGFGSVAPEPAVQGRVPASAKIGSAVPGLLAVSLAVEGQRVAKGTTLFQLDSRVADVQVEKARQAVEFAQTAFDRQKNLLSVDGTSRKLYQEAEQQLQAATYELANATAQRALLTIQAPIAGTVIHVTAKPGDAIDLSTPLAELIDLERLVVAATIRTSDVHALRLGQRADVSPGRQEGGDQTAPPPVTATATVSYIGGDVDQANDTVTVRATLPARSGLRPGEFVTLRILTGDRPNCLAVPVDSVISDVGSTSASIAVVEDNAGERRPVTLGIQENGLVEIHGEGIQEGTTIVTMGAYSLPDHTKVRQASQ